MKRRWIGVLMGTVLIALLLGNPVLAFYRWHVNDGIGYGSQGVSWGKINEFNQAFESFTRDVVGIEDFEIGELKESSPVYFISRRIEISPNWEIGLSLSGLLGDFISEFGEKSISLPGGGEKTTRAAYDLIAGMVSANLTGCYKFNLWERVSPFIQGGIGGYSLNVMGNYLVQETTYTPPWDYQSRYLQESLLLSGTGVGYTLGAGLDWMAVKSVFDVRVRVELGYHWIPEMTGEVYADSEGFFLPGE